MARKQIIVTLALLALPLMAAAQSLEKLMQIAPDAVTPVLRADMRKALLGIYETGMRPAQVPNLFGKVAVLDTLSANYLLMRPTADSRLEVMKLFNPADSTDVLCVINTVQVLDVEHSSVQFYGPSWSPLPRANYATYLQLDSTIINKIQPYDEKRSSYRIEPVR